MKIRELLKNFNGSNAVKVHDTFDDSTHDFHSYEQAILHYGHYTVRNWSVENDTINIIIQSQF